MGFIEMKLCILSAGWRCEVLSEMFTVQTTSSSSLSCLQKMCAADGE